MGVPRVMPRSIEIPGVGEPIDGAMVNVGNPHFVLFPGQRQTSAATASPGSNSAQGSPSTPSFPTAPTSSSSASSRPTEIAFRIYERGCGPTTSSGTGTCASATAAIFRHNAARNLTAIAEGGAQQVVWPTNSSDMLLTGPAEIICTGEVDFA